jgi:hypothetical protein
MQPQKRDGRDFLPDSRMGDSIKLATDSLPNNS